MFESKYKEDALKWRALEVENRRKEESRVFKLLIEVSLNDGDTQYKTCLMRGKQVDQGWTDPDWVVIRGDILLKDKYRVLKEEVGKVGIEVDGGMFLPHSSVHHIRKISIEEVASE